MVAVFDAKHDFSAADIRRMYTNERLRKILLWSRSQNSIAYSVSRAHFLRLQTAKRHFQSEREWIKSRVQERRQFQQCRLLSRVDCYRRKFALVMGEWIRQNSFLGMQPAHACGIPSPKYPSGLALDDKRGMRFGELYLRNNLLPRHSGRGKSHYRWHEGASAWFSLGGGHYDSCGRAILWWFTS